MYTITNISKHGNLQFTHYIGEKVGKALSMSEAMVSFCYSIAYSKFSKLYLEVTFTAAYFVFIFRE